MYQMKQAAGEQQNDMARYLHGMSDQIKDMNDSMSQELKDVLEQISQMRNERHPERVAATVLPDGTVQLSTGEIVDGVRGAPSGDAAACVAPTGCHVEGRVLPDGTVMVGDKVVVGVQGVPRAPTAEEQADEARRAKERADDERLKSLEDKIATMLGAKPAAEASKSAEHDHDHEHEHHDHDHHDHDKETDKEKTTEKITEKSEKVIEHIEKEKGKDKETAETCVPRYDPYTGRPLAPPGGTLVREEVEEVSPKLRES